MNSQTGSCRAGEREVASVALRISTELFLCIIYVYAFTAAPWGDSWMGSSGYWRSVNCSSSEILNFA